ncbi:MAG: proline--tRNA ligase [Candidatus Woesearchaeota archaeon]
MAENKSTLGINVKKDDNFSEWFTQVCSEEGAKLADIRYGVQGHVVHRPWAMKILNKMYRMFEEELEADDHNPVLMPTVIPEKHLMKETEHAGFTPEVFWVTEAGSKKLNERVALRPTGETAFYPMYSLWIRSYNDLPLKCYQSRITVFRNEMTTRPFLRGREFMFFESHDVFATHDDALAQVNKDMEIMRSVVNDKLKIPYKFFKRPQWDKFKGADDTYAADSLLPDGRRSQISSTHDLGTRFAKAYDIKFKDKDSKDKYAFQTCFGPGIWRIMASLISIHGDDNGLVLPMDVAPTQIVIVPITFVKKPKISQNVLDMCKQVKRKLDKKFSVKIDDSDNSPGFKYNQAELMGIPIRIEIGPKDLEKSQVTLVRRTSKDKFSIPLDDISKSLSEHSHIFEEELLDRAKEHYNSKTRYVKTMDEAKRVLHEHKGFVVAPFCSMDKDGEEYADILKAETNGGVVCGVPLGEEEKPKDDDVCIVSGKKAEHMVWIAKTI